MEHPQLIAVGYLAQGEPFSRGPIGEVFVGALLDLLLDPWQPSVAAGFHRCEFCWVSGGPQRLQYADRSIPLGASNLYVPHEGKIFVSPSLIAHYVDAHEYAPPQVFQEAVLRFPPMRSLSTSGPSSAMVHPDSLGAKRVRSPAKPTFSFQRSRYLCLPPQKPRRCTFCSCKI